MSPEIKTPNDAKENLDKNIKAESGILAPDSIEESNDRLQNEVLGSVDKYAANVAQKERVSNSIKNEIETRKGEESKRAELKEQIAAGQDMVKFNNRSWRPQKTEEGDIVLLAPSLSEKGAEKQRLRDGQALRIKSDENFNASIELNRQKLEQLWTENSEIEQKFGGPKKFSEIQGKVKEIRDVEQQLAEENTLKQTIDNTQANLRGVNDYAGAFTMGGGLTEASKKVREADVERYKKELLGAEERLNKFYDKKPDLAAKRTALSGELRSLAGGKK